MSEDKYRLWRVLHPNEWQCHYCRKSREYPHCLLLIHQDYKNCREFLKPKNYQPPNYHGYQGKYLNDAGVFYAPYIPVQYPTKKGKKIGFREMVLRSVKK